MHLDSNVRERKRLLTDGKEWFREVLKYLLFCDDAGSLSETYLVDFELANGQQHPKAFACMYLSNRISAQQGSHCCTRTS